ncbi:MAG: 3-deoxy-manno-octulosonate cytidylyltransferase [Sutterella sp.]|nr:3-deoxy-manno-octulosonate cytidylyltransferase [Sutterella sp.]
MSFVILIPARLKSSRLPNKPLADILGKPMVVRVAERAKQSAADRVIVAVDAPEVYEACAGAGLDVVLTSVDHPTGTDRLAEAVTRLGLPDEAIVVNVQGDEPLMPISVINDVAQLLERRPDCAMATAAHPIADREHFLNPNVVKVVIDHQGTALNFSRAPMPWPRDHFREEKPGLPEGLPALHHLGLYAYRVGFLKRFPTLAQAPLEKFESLEQLRALYYGERIAVMVLNEALPPGVDTQDDLERVRALFAQS